jgi:hypothetical protein
MADPCEFSPFSLFHYDVLILLLMLVRLPTLDLSTSGVQKDIAMVASLPTLSVIITIVLIFRRRKNPIFLPQLHLPNGIIELMWWKEVARTHEGVVLQAIWGWKWVSISSRKDLVLFYRIVFKIMAIIVTITLACSLVRWWSDERREKWFQFAKLNGR